MLFLSSILSCAGAKREQPAENASRSSRTDPAPAEQPPQEKSPETPEPETTTPEKTPEQPPSEKQAPVEKPVDRFDAAAGLMREGKVEEAVTELGKAVEEAPDDTETILAYAMLLLSEGYVDEAVGNIRKVMEQEPDNADAVFLHSMALYLQGDESGRLDELNRVLELDPGHSDAHAALGEIEAAAGNSKEAEQHFTRSLERDEENISALLGLGELMIQDEEYEQAIELYDRAVKASAENPIAYIDRSRAYRATERFEAAESDLTTAIDLMPEYYWNYIDRGKLRLFQLGDLDGALHDFSEAVAIDPDLFYAYVYRAGILDDMSRYEEALEDYRRVVDDNPDYQFAYRPMGRLAYIVGDGTTARRYFKKAGEYDPEDESYIFMNFLCYLRDGDEDGAEEYLRKELPGLSRDDIFYHIGRSFLESGYYGMASRRLQELKDPVLKARMKFYIGEFQLLHGADMLAADLFLEVHAQEMPANLEYKLAEWRLEEMGIK